MPHIYVVRPLLRWIIVGIAVLAGTAHSAAGAMIDHRGREFRVTFMPNLGSAGGESSRLRLYLLGEKETAVTITYTLTGVSRDVRIGPGTLAAVVDINALFGDATELDDFTIGNSVTGKSFVISADNDISVVGINMRSKSADAFLALPVRAFGTHYYVLAYPNGWEASLNRSDTPSEFAVVATEDGTRLRVTRPDGVKINGRSEPTFTVILNRGEVFIGQAQLLQDADVTGTEISADHPVAVFAGTKRAANPGHIGNYRDHMVEQLVPDAFWRTTAVAVPRPPHADQVDSILYRIIARDSATVSILSGDYSGNFQVARRGVIPFSSVAPVRIVSTAPILVAQYDPSQAPRGGSPSFAGDPSMSIVPAPEQWDTAYTFISIPEPEFSAHFVDVIVPRTIAVKLDGQSVDAPRRNLDGTLDYFHLQVQPGRHRISASVPIGVAVYGAADAMSYAYPGGLVLGETPASVGKGFQGDSPLLAIPNPVTGNYLDLEFPADTWRGLHVEVIDERGAVMAAVPGTPSSSGGKGRMRMDISALPAGTYFCRVTGIGAGYSVTKFIRR